MTLKKVLVTGASYGIGRGIAEAFARKKYTLGILARSKDRLEENAEEFRGFGSTCHHRVCDLTSQAEIDKQVSDLIGEMNGVDVLINNAGVVIRKPMMALSPEEYRCMMQTNVDAVFHLSRLAIPHMQKQGRGHIINISSISGKVPLPGGSVYAASKYAVTGLSQSLFHELRDDGIKVTVVYPGSVDSESHRNDGADHSWKVTPLEVGEACVDIVETTSRNCISELEIRPLKKPVS